MQSILNFYKNNFKFDVYLFSKSEDTIKIISDEINLTPSFLRGFSAPVILEADLTIDEYVHILRFDNDSYNRWDAIQNLYLDCYLNKSTVKPLCDTLRTVSYTHLTLPTKRIV